MLATGTDERQVLLGSAFDLPCTAYACGPLTIRPYSLNAHRRAEALGLVIVAAGVDVARKVLPPVRYLAELDALHWLLAGDLDEVCSAFRAGIGKAKAAAARSTLPAGTAGLFSDEMERILAIAKASLFNVVERPRKMGSEPDPVPPPDQLEPGVLAGLVLALADRLRASEDYILEWLPFPRAMQYLHAIQFQSPLIWTIAPSALGPEPIVDAPPEDPGFGEAIDF